MHISEYLLNFREIYVSLKVTDNWILIAYQDFFTYVYTWYSCQQGKECNIGLGARNVQFPAV